MSEKEPAFKSEVAGVDRAFEDKWKAEEISPADPAAELQVARRLSLALTGTIPSLEEIRQFGKLAERTTIELVGRSLVARPPVCGLLCRRGWPVVTWAPKTGRSFSIGVAGSCSGSRMSLPRISRTTASSANSSPTRGSGPTARPRTSSASPPRRTRRTSPNPVRLAGRVTRAFLGLRLDCAQCHNHPFAAWKQDDFQGLSAFFGQTTVGFTGIQDGPGEYEIEDRKTQAKKVIPPKVPFSPELLPKDGTRRQQLAAWVTNAKNPYFAKATVNRVWALMFGKPLVDPVDGLEPEGPTPLGAGPVGERLRGPQLRPAAAHPVDCIHESFPARQ